MDLFFILVNYNNSKLTIECIDSLLKQKNIPLDVSIKILVVDNNSTLEEIVILKKWNSEYKQKMVVFLFSNVNLGYFGAFNYALKLIKEKNKTVVISNNDLIFDDFFAANIFKNNYDDLTLVLSPDIVTPRGIHQNPHVIARVSYLRRLFYKMYFVNYKIACCITKLVKIFALSKQEVSKYGYEKEQFVYMGFGACYVLLPSFFSCFEKLDDRVFLMGEEALLGHQVQSSGGKILYTPILKVTHLDHSTFKKMPSKVIYEMTRKSYFIYKKYL